MSEIARFSVSVTVRGPFMFPGLANSRLGVDVSFLRNESGSAIIPADQIKGVLFAACRVLQARAPKVAPESLISRLFGGASREGSNDEPDRALLLANDLLAEEQPRSTLTRIEINDATGAVEGGALQVVELAACPGARATFNGELVLLAETGMAPREVETLLSRAIKLVPAIGAFKSAGFGEIVDASVKMTESKPAIAVTSANTAKRVAYRVTFDRPILVDAVRETDNLFVGSMVVPGTVFKGALATLLKLAGHDPNEGLWTKAVAALRISHAFPENDFGDLSCLPVPASLYAWESGDDVLLADGLLRDISENDAMTGFVTKVDGKSVAPEHPVDWKDKYFAALCAQGLLPEPALPAQQPRTHVKIDPDLFIAEDANLYTTVAQGVLGKDRRTPRAWRLVIDFEDVAQECCGVLRALIEEGLFPIGRTGAEARFGVITEAPGDAAAFGRIRLAELPSAASVAGHYDLYAITLLTPALLTDPRSDEAVEHQYKSLIHEQTGGGLLRAYTSRRLAGGYIATRRRPYGDAYYPFILTEPGSVFLIRGADKGKLATVARYGLLPTGLSGVETLDWRNCSYLRENGYGEVAFSLIDHAKLGTLGDGDV